MPIINLGLNGCEKKEGGRTQKYRKSETTHKKISFSCSNISFFEHLQEDMTKLSSPYQIPYASCLLLMNVSQPNEQGEHITQFTPLHHSPHHLLSGQ